jgi:hypothetical protein
VGKFVWRRSRYILSIEEYSPLINTIKTGDEIEYRGLTSTVRPDDPNRLSLINGKGDSINSLYSAKAFSVFHFHTFIVFPIR